MKDLVYLGMGALILAPVFVCAMCENLVVVFVGVLYGILLATFSHHPRVRKFILRVYRAELRLFSGKLTIGL